MNSTSLKLSNHFSKIKLLVLTVFVLQAASLNTQRQISLKDNLEKQLNQQEVINEIQQEQVKVVQQLMDFEASYFSFVKENHEQLQAFEPSQIRDIIYNAIDGFMLYTYISNGQQCVQNIDLYVQDILNMTISFNEVQFLRATLNFTNSMGRFSPILRNCYEVGGSLDRNWGPYWKSWTSFQSAYDMIKINVVQNYTDIDNRGSSLYDSLQVQNYPQISFDTSRIIFLIFFQTLTRRIPLKAEWKDAIERKILGASPEDFISKYPPDLLTLDYFSLGSEYTYQLFRGAKLTDQKELDKCEQNITELSYHFNNAVKYFQYGQQINRSDVQREGIFRVADSFMRLTNMTFQCYSVYKLAEYTLTTVVSYNAKNPVIILTNAAAEFFYICSNFAAQFANIVYKDWMSFTYWAGDLFYRFFVVNHTDDQINS